MTIYNEDLINDLAQQKVVLFLGQGCLQALTLMPIIDLKVGQHF